MSDVQRWSVTENEHGEAVIYEDSTGPFVLYAAHAAALIEQKAWCLGEQVVASAEGYERGKAAATPRTLTADEWEAIAQQFRMAYLMGACDPSNCPACDCNMDDEGRTQLAGMALQQAQAVIRIVHGEA